MKRFTIPIQAEDHEGKFQFHIYIGEPHVYRSPLYYQRLWLKNSRGASFSQEVYDNFHELFLSSHTDDVSCEALCLYALGDSQHKTETKIPEKPKPKTAYPHFGSIAVDEKEIRFLIALCNQIFCFSEHHEEDYFLVFHILIIISRIGDYQKRLHALLFCHSTESQDDMLYNIAVILDTVGYSIPVDTLGFFEFFLNMHEDAQYCMFAGAVAQITAWLDNADDKLSDDILVQHMLTNETYDHIKNEFKAARNYAEKN